MESTRTKLKHSNEVARVTLPDWTPSVRIEVERDNILIRNLSSNEGIIQSRQTGTYLRIRYFISVLFLSFILELNVCACFTGAVAVPHLY